MYAKLIDWGYNAFRAVQHEHVWLPLILTPAGAALSVWLTESSFAARKAAAFHRS
ncbi:MAG: hypothetical protein CBARDCOR_5510 [uncultured Caballeronia sp.]|nr:MAG: hypothetical protein CBARDCOR_5510 [uncultured Caballeronia sp.]